MKYILNSAVITSPGIYEYRLITPEEARFWIEGVRSCENTIGYHETQEALEILLERKFPEAMRRKIRMEIDDEALVFRLTCRLDDPSLKGKMGVDFILENCEIGLLWRKS